MDDENGISNLPGDVADQRNAHQVRSLQELIKLATGNSSWETNPEEKVGIMEALPFPFLALVGQPEMKMGLLLSLINPSIGGVLLIGPPGTGKTTAVRSLINLLPAVSRSLCYYGCMPEDIESGGIDAVCPECVQKYAAGEPLATLENVRLVELPLNSQIEDVVGGLDERTSLHGRFRIQRGLLSQADRNILYIDEVNLISNEIVDAILDAAAQGSYVVRRGPLTGTYRSRFILIGSMDPEEGSLRPQIMDRFGLRIFVLGLNNPEDRLETYRRVHDFLMEPRKIIKQYHEETENAKLEIQNARNILARVQLPEDVARFGLRLIKQLNIDSLRAEITLFEAARAYAAFDNRDVALTDDIRTVALMALRMRRSPFITKYSSEQKNEEDEILKIVEKLFNEASQIGE